MNNKQNNSNTYIDNDNTYTDNDIAKDLDINNKKK